MPDGSCAIPLIIALHKFKNVIEDFLNENEKSVMESSEDCLKKNNVNYIFGKCF